MGERQMFPVQIMATRKRVSTTGLLLLDLILKRKEAIK
jgi:hypothetical protein